MKNIYSLFVFLLTSFILLTLNVSHAVDISWGNSASDFNSGASWLGGTAPGDPDIAVFSAATATNHPQITADIEMDGIRFDAGTAAWIFSTTTSSTIKIDTTSGIINNSTNTQTFNVDVDSKAGSGLGIDAAAGAIVFNGDMRFGTSKTIQGSFDVTINGSIFETNATTRTITKEGTGNLYLTGDNTSFGDGKFVINEGTMFANGVNSLGTLVTPGTSASPSIKIAGGGTLDINNTNTAITGRVSAVGPSSGTGGILNANATDSLKNIDTIELGQGTLLNLGGGTGITDRINDNADIYLTSNHNDATIQTNGVSETVGALTFTTNSDLNIDMGDGGTLTFASITQIATNQVTISNWSGTTNNGGGTTQLRFTADPTATSGGGFVEGPDDVWLSSDDSYFKWADYSSGSGWQTRAFDFGTYWEIMPYAVPEPSTYLALLLLLAAIFFLERRRLLVGWALLKSRFLTSV